MSVTRTSSSGRARSGVCAFFAGAAIAIGLAGVVDGAAAQSRNQGTQSRPTVGSGETIRFASPEAAYNHGLSSLKSGHPEMALRSFEYAARHGIFVAQFFLGRLYADNSIALTDHGKAFDIFRQIVNEHVDIDVDDDPRAPFVAKAMTALADYYRSGIRSAGVAPDPEQAANLLRNAAKTFRDEDAQFEYAKALLTGDGLVANPREALYWLRGLTTRGHVGAQAFLADLYWRGLYVERDQTQALLLITLAAEYATAADRTWIEDKYQNIFCGAGEGVRRQAQGAVADWRSKYGRSQQERMSRDGLQPIQPRAVRTCSNGEVAQPMRKGEAMIAPRARTEMSGGLRPATGAPQAEAPAATGRTEGFMQGNAAGFSLREAGSSSLAPAR